MNAEDNRKLAAFAKNKNLKPKSRSRIWETRMSGAITAAASLIAFVISIATFYYTNLRQADDLRVVIDTFPSVVFLGNPVQISVESWPTTFTFINSGSRAIAISRVALLIAQPGSFNRRQPTCLYPQLTVESVYGELSIDYEMVPFVVKPSDILIKTLNLKKITDKQAAVSGSTARASQPAKATEDPVTLTLPLTPENQFEVPGYYLLACMFFGLTTPDSSVAYSITPLSKDKYSSTTPFQKDLSNGIHEPLYSTDRPIQALKESSIPLFQSFRDWVSSWVEPKGS